jgi:hypothetical protein
MDMALHRTAWLQSDKGDVTGSTLRYLASLRGSGLYRSAKEVPPPSVLLNYLPPTWPPDVPTTDVDATAEWTWHMRTNFYGSPPLEYMDPPLSVASRLLTTVYSISSWGDLTTEVRNGGAASMSDRLGRNRASACSQCSSWKSVQGHHDSYRRPNDVRWLCAKCHTQWHAWNEPERADYAAEAESMWLYLFRHRLSGCGLPLTAEEQVYGFGRSPYGVEYIEASKAQRMFKHDVLKDVAEGSRGAFAIGHQVRVEVDDLRAASGD